MFTGITQTMGTVQSIQRGSAGTRLTLNAPHIPRPLIIGSSICVNGVCLTVVDSDDSNIEFDVVPETTDRSTLGSLKTGDRVNLENSLKLGDPMDGHMVQGHVDGIARVSEIRKDSQGHILTLTADDSVVRFVVPKGSVAVDGVSLTVAGATDRNFSVALVPTTLEKTTLGLLQVNDSVNVETDILVRTIVHSMQRLKKSSDTGTVTWDMLQKQGFL